ncbi:MAG TPA: Tat pathway signal protein [Noviherbaspirillum sp.]
MTSRRIFMQNAAIGLSAPLALPAYASDGAAGQYDEAVRAIWRHSNADGMTEQGHLMRELVRYATLAPSSHNTQCWKFAIGKNEISILPDFSRRCPVVDPDDHHLWVSLGCAAENLSLAARANGYESLAQVENGRIRIRLDRARPAVTPLFDAIPRRQCTRAEYDGKPIANEELRLLERAGTGRGVRVLLLNDKTVMESVLAYIVQANTRQMSDRAFVEELKEWIRFGDREAVLTGDGLSSRASGNPSVPRWLGSLLFGLVFTPQNENEKCARQVRSSAGIAVFVSEASSEAHWVEVGRCYERFALQATALGIRNAFLNQPVEVEAVRGEFASALGIGGYRPDLVVRFGRGGEMPRSLRRGVEGVLV